MALVTKNGDYSVESMDVPTSLAHQFIGKLKSRNATADQIEQAEKLFQRIRFEDYEEKCSARLMQFAQDKADEVIDRFCKSQNWSEDTAEGLKFAAAVLDADRSSETWIKFQKGKDGEFYVNFVAMRRIGDKIHMGLARHHVIFKLAPFAYEKSSHDYAFYSWFHDFNNNAPAKEQASLSLEDVTALENLFLTKAMRKFTEDFPANVNRLPQEDRRYLTMGSS